MKAKTEDKCIWMSAGVINHKLCPYNYACNLCAFDQAMKAAGQETAPQKRKVPWPERMRTLGGPEKYCRHMLQGLVSYKLCPLNYECGSCKYDQMVNDTIGDAALPKLRQVAGFAIAPTYHYHRKHAWATVEYGGKCRVGFDDFSGRLLGEQREFVLPKVGQRVAQNEPFMRVKTANRVFDLESPIDGVVVAVNPLQDRPAELEPYSDGWVAFVEPTPRVPANLKKLLYADTAVEWLTDSSDKLIEALTPGAPLAADGGIIAADVFTRLEAEKRADLIENILLAG
jgi:glycine cleavage system H lipoate-binding protein